MSERVFAGKPIIGWVADSSLPRFGKLLREPHSRRIFAVDVEEQRILPLGAGPGRQVNGPSRGYVFDGAWHPDHGLILAFGRSHGRGPWALLRVCQDNSVQDIGVSTDLAVISLCCTDDGHLLLGVASVEVADGRQVGGGIASFSPLTRFLHWLYRPPAGEHFVPSGICWDSGDILFVHTSKHALLRLVSEDHVEDVIGNPGRPGADLRSLNSPAAVSAANGRYLLTDRGNRRVLLVDTDGNVLGVYGGNEEGTNLIDPRHALIIDDRVYIVDQGTRAVLELSADMRTARRRWGGPEATGLVLSRPRSIDRAAAGELVVADTNNDRIIGVDENGGLSWEIRTVQGLDGRSEDMRWPRSARISGAGRLIVSDSLNSRFVIMNRHGKVESEFERVILRDDSFDVSDPHDGRWIGEDELLAVDSGSAWVARVRCDGVAAWVISGLHDPHQAEIFGEWAVIVDPELNAVLLVDAASGVEVWRKSEFFDHAGASYQLVKPRVVRAAADCLLIVDADCQVIALGKDWVVQWAWTGDAARIHGNDKAFEVPEAPRDLVIENMNRILLSDYRRNCVLELTADSELI
jgi:hypothetical protein